MGGAGTEHSSKDTNPIIPSNLLFMLPLTLLHFYLALSVIRLQGIILRAPSTLTLEGFYAGPRKLGSFSLFFRLHSRKISLIKTRHQQHTIKFNEIGLGQLILGLLQPTCPKHLVRRSHRGDSTPRPSLQKSQKWRPPIGPRSTHYPAFSSLDHLTSENALSSHVITSISPLLKCCYHVLYFQ